MTAAARKRPEPAAAVRREPRPRKAPSGHRHHPEKSRPAPISPSVPGESVEPLRVQRKGNPIYAKYT